MGSSGNDNRVVLRKNSGADLGSRPRVNLIEGSGIAITTSDDPTDNELDVTIAATGGGGVTDHSALTGLTTGDPHTQYAFLGGRAGGQTYIAGIAAGDDLHLKGTSHATPGDVIVDNGQLIVPDGAVGNVGLRHPSNAAGTGWVAGSSIREEWHAADVARVLMSNAGIWVQNGAGIANQATSSTTPSICPSLTGDGDTGLGSAGANQLSGIAGGVEVLRASAAISGVSDGLRSLRCIEANTAVAASPNLLATAESRNLLHNTGATAENYHTLPASAPIGYEQWFACQDTDGIRIVAQTGEVISLGPGAVSAAGGFVKSTVIGSVAGLIKITSTKYIAISVIGTWTVDA